jgi:hypothetical protein
MVRRGRAVVALAVALGGCSFAGVERLQADYRVEDVPACSSTMLPVGADALLALSAIASAILIFTEDDTTRDDSSLGYTQLGVGTTFLGSAVYGYREASRCARARGQHRVWLLRGPR